MVPDKSTVFSNALNILQERSIPIDSDRLREVCVTEFDNFDRHPVECDRVDQCELILTYRIVADYHRQIDNFYRLDVMYLNRCLAIDINQTRFDVGELD